MLAQTGMMLFGLPHAYRPPTSSMLWMYSGLRWANSLSWLLRIGPLPPWPLTPWHCAQFAW